MAAGHREALIYLSSLELILEQIVLEQYLHEVDYEVSNLMALRLRFDSTGGQLPQRSQHVRAYDRGVKNRVAAQILEPYVAKSGLHERLDHTKH